MTSSRASNERKPPLHTLASSNTIGMSGMFTSPPYQLNSTALSMAVNRAVKQHLQFIQGLETQMAHSANQWYNPAQLQPNPQCNLSLQLQVVQFLDTGYTEHTLCSTTLMPWPTPLLKLESKKANRLKAGQSLFLHFLCFTECCLNSVTLDSNQHQALAQSSRVLSVISPGAFATRWMNNDRKVAYCFGVGFFPVVF